MNADTLLEGNNLACLAFQFAGQAKPDLLGALDPITGALGPLTDALSQATSTLSCPQLDALDKAQLEMFPGYERSDV